MTLIDPETPAGEHRSGSAAALGLLMAQVFHRASGRAWRLRQRSLELWSQWITALAASGHPVSLRRGLLLLAADGPQLARLQALCQERRTMGLPLELWDRERVAALQPRLPEGAIGGLWSAADGQIDPLPVLRALLHDGQRLGVTRLTSPVTAIERRAERWLLRLANGDAETFDAVVVCAGAGSRALLHSLGHPIALLPVLGQALELCSASAAEPWQWSPRWPAAVVWQGINLVPRPNGHLWLGATLEPGTEASPSALAALANLEGAAPAWLQQASVVQRWQGLRLQPQGRGAPWLEQLEPGLLLAGGHYRNGLLLAPATAEWIGQQLEQGARTAP